MNLKLREMNFWLREKKKIEVREMNLSCEVLDSQSHRNNRTKMFSQIILPFFSGKIQKFKITKTLC